MLRFCQILKDLGWSLHRGRMGWAALLLAQSASGESLLDSSFRLDPAIRGRIDAIQLRPDGHILIAGKLRIADEPRFQLVQLDSEGGMDPSFKPYRPDWLLDEHAPMSVAILPDGRALLATGWSGPTGTAGSVTAISADGQETSPWAHFGAILSLTPLRDGKVMVWGTGGTIIGTAGLSSGFLQRRFADGQIDQEFVVVDGLVNHYGGEVRDLFETQDGDLLVAGTFESGSVLRLSRDGDLKWAFYWPDAGHTAGFSRQDPQGRTVVVGTHNGSVDRLRADGTLDRETFDAPPYWRAATPSLLLRDGRLLDSGPFRSIAGLRRRGLVSLLEDGSVDLRFDPGEGLSEDSEVRALIEHPDGRILVAGRFTNFDGFTAPGMMRLFSTNPGIPATPTNLFYSRILRSSIAECGDPFRVRITRAGDLGATHTVRVRTEPGTATPDADFVPLDTELGFQPGERFKTVTVRMKADQIPEAEETFRVSFESGSPVVAFADSDPIQVTIRDQDCLIRFATNQVFIVEGEYPSYPHPDMPMGISVRVRTEDLSAKAGIDYPSIDEVLGHGWDLGLHSFDNPRADGDRSYRVEFVDQGEGYIFGYPSNVVVTIRDNDTPLGPARMISGELAAVHAAPEGRWLLSGSFDRVDGWVRPGIARFEANGALDPQFSPPEGLLSGAPVAAVDAQGRVYVGGAIRADLDFDGAGLVRLQPDGTADSAFHFMVAGKALPPCRRVSNQISHLLVNSMGELIVSGILPRFSDCNAPAQVVRFSSSGERKELWTLPENLSVIREVRQEPGTLLAISPWGVARLIDQGSYRVLHDSTSRDWKGRIGPVCSWPDGTLWVEGEYGKLMQISPVTGRATVLDTQVTVEAEPFEAIQFQSLTSLNPGEMLVCGNFRSVTNPERYRPLLLRMSASGTILQVSTFPEDVLDAAPSLFAVGKDGVIAGIHPDHGLSRNGLKWLRFSSDLRPIADLAIDAVLPALDGGAFLRLSGQAPNGYSLETSDDLVTWSPASTHSEINWGQTFLEPETSHSQNGRFFRARY